MTLASDDQAEIVLSPFSHLPISLAYQTQDESMYYQCSHATKVLLQVPR